MKFLKLLSVTALFISSTSFAYVRDCNIKEVYAGAIGLSVKCDALDEYNRDVHRIDYKDANISGEKTKYSLLNLANLLDHPVELHLNFDGTKIVKVYLRKDPSALLNLGDLQVASSTAIFLCDPEVVAAGSEQIAITCANTLSLKISNNRYIISKTFTLPIDQHDSQDTALVQTAAAALLKGQPISVQFKLDQAKTKFVLDKIRLTNY